MNSFFTSSHSDPLRLTHQSYPPITQTHSSLRPTHHSDSLTTQAHSSLGPTHHPDSSLITQTHSSLRLSQSIRLTHHSDSLVLALIHPLHSFRSTHRMSHAHTHTDVEDVSGDSVVSALLRGAAG
eukprot:5627585-Pyramimonas_sp.AAC.1